MHLKKVISDLHKLIARLWGRISTLEQVNRVLEAENAELRARLAQTSKNSHHPPSSEGYQKPNAVPKKKTKSSKKVGGQPKHPGKTLEMVRQPDQIVLHQATHCRVCGKDFQASEVIGVVGKRQVFDLPPPRLEVTEHQLGVSCCCGLPQIGNYPVGVDSPTQYGARIRSLSSLLNTDYRLPYHKIKSLFTDLYGCSFNESTAVSANASLYKSLQPSEERIRKALLEAQVAHFDETGMRVAGKLHWFHTACNEDYCYLYMHPKRGKEALEAPESVLKDFQHWAVHDCWASYFKYDTCQHALCNAHLLRELQALIEQGSRWASAMKTFLLELHQAAQQNGSMVPNPPQWRQKYQQICQQADREEPPPEKRARAKPKNSKGRNLLKRLVKYQEAVLAFAFHPEVPFTNNLAEQAIRTIKIKQKVAMSFRTRKGAQIYARIQGFISTLRKQGINVFEALVKVNQGKEVVFKAT